MKSDMKLGLQEFAPSGLKIDVGWLWRHNTLSLKSTFILWINASHLGPVFPAPHFHRMSNAIEAIFRHHTKSVLNNYLDDFLFIALLRWLCNQHLQVFLKICNEVKFLVAIDKI